MPATAPPIVLIRTDFAPFTERPLPVAAPGGRIILLDPSDEVAFLLSLRDAGIFQVETLDAP